MRIGRLNTPCTLLALPADLQAMTIDQLWCSVTGKEGDAPAAASLRSAAKIEVRAWYSADLIAGRYLRTLDGADRLLIIDSVRDVAGQQAELVITCSELIGEPAEYRPQAGVALACRVYLDYSAPWLDDLGQVTEYRTRAEVALLEVGRPQAGDQLFAGGRLWDVIAYDNNSDDRQVRRLWLQESPP